MTAKTVSDFRDQPGLRARHPTLVLSIPRLHAQHLSCRHPPNWRSGLGPGGLRADLRDFHTEHWAHTTVMGWTTDTHLGHVPSLLLGPELPIWHPTPRSLRLEGLGGQAGSASIDRFTTDRWVVVFFCLHARTRKQQTNFPYGRAIQRSVFPTTAGPDGTRL